MKICPRIFEISLRIRPNFRMWGESRDRTGCDPDPGRISLLLRYSTDTRSCNNDEIRGATVLGREKRGEEKGITFRQAEIMSKYANRLGYTRLRALNWRAETGTRARRAEGERRARRETSR